MRLPRMTTRRWMIVVAIVALSSALALKFMERRRQLRTLAQARYAAALSVYTKAEWLFMNGEISVVELASQSRRLLDAQRARGD